MIIPALQVTQASLLEQTELTLASEFTTDPYHKYEQQLMIQLAC